ncbi:S-adenosyl-L-methionine-dependent methyltransferase [Apiospora kogelbergensis]|uniref:S-adenosyl-L-methionine-dependent methyltransferase n=1 Tax=Apiospora kogelbergensis TaxID=1337665 RepID=UPI003131022F
MPSSYLPSTEELEPLITEINASYQQFLRGTSSSPSSDSSEEDDQGLREQAAALGKAARQLRALVADPDDWMIEACWSYLDVAALSSVIAMKIPSLIPVDGSATAETLAKETGGSPEVIMSGLSSAIPIIIHLYQSRVTYNPNKARVPIYEYYGTVDAGRGERFSKGMVGYFEATEKSIETLFPFETLPAGSTIVDIGAATGANAIRLITLYPQLNCVVQDYGDIVSAAARAAKTLPKSVNDRIVWDGYDYYTPQTQMGAAIYLMSHILNGNTDEKVVKMFKNVVHGMKPRTSTLLILDWVDPPSFGEDRPRVFDSLDMHMIAQTNVHSRSLERWDKMLKQADERLVRYYTKVEDNGCAALAVRLE